MQKRYSFTLIFTFLFLIFSILSLFYIGLNITGFAILDDDTYCDATPPLPDVENELIDNINCGPTNGLMINLDNSILFCNNYSILGLSSGENYGIVIDAQNISLYSCN